MMPIQVQQIAMAAYGSPDMRADTCWLKGRASRPRAKGDHGSEPTPNNYKKNAR